MNLKVLLIILIYYTLISLIIGVNGSSFDDYDSNVNLDDSGISEDENISGGLFSSGLSFGRFASLVTIGIGLPDDTPAWFSFLFSAWQILWLIFTAGFFVSSIWDG